MTLFGLAGALTLSQLLLKSEDARNKVQSVLMSILSLKAADPILDGGNKIKVEKELDQALENFFKKIIKTFISSWYTNVTQDESFVLNIKLELTEAIRTIAQRLSGVSNMPLFRNESLRFLISLQADHSRLLSNKLLPVIYSHFNILDRIENSSDDKVSAFNNENSIHPATFNRSSELNFLRFLSKGLLRILVSPKNFECKVAINLLTEILSCSVLLPLTDVICDPATINLLVILATNPKIHKRARKSNAHKVFLLESFMQEFKMDLSVEDDEGGNNINRNFLKDQEKLYSFMQHLKSKSNADIDLLKFFLDVEHLNSELEKSNVICDPYRLSEMQQQSEKLLRFYQTEMFKGNNGEKMPDDLLQAHDQAQRELESKWKNDFYKSAEYFQLIYGDKESSFIPTRTADVTDASFPQYKLTSKLKNVMSIRTGAVEGIEATEIPIWDALDHPLGHTSYYNSVAVKLRKERGQDLDSFMQTFFHSIEQDADVGEDVASTQTQDEAKHRQKKKQNHELYKNLFNFPEQSQTSQFTTVPQVKSSVDSAIYFLASILKIHRVLLKGFRSFVRFLPDADNIVCGLIRKLLHKLLDEATLAELINELEEKVFDSKPSTVATNEELLKRHELATKRIESVNKNLGKILSFLQNPVLNKHLVYCLIDVIVVEIFPEFNLDAKD